MRDLVIQAKGIVSEMIQVSGDMPPAIREGSRKAYEETVGEPMEETVRRLTRMERRLLTTSPADVPRQELISLKDRMTKLDEHLTESYFGARKLSGSRAGRKAIKSSAKESSRKVAELVRELGAALR